MEAKGQSRSATESSQRPAAAVVVLVFLAAVLLYWLDIKASAEPSYLAFVLNTLFIGLPSLMVAVISIRSFLYAGAWPVLFFGVGAITFGAGTILGGLLVTLSQTNLAVTASNLIFLMGAILFSLGGFFALYSVPPVEDRSQRTMALLHVYVSVTVIVVAVIVVSIVERLPPFFIQGQGGTPIRELIIGLAAAFFLLAAAIAFRRYADTKNAFLFWYSLGLLLIFIGMLGILMQTAMGSPLNWLARGSEMLGGVYLFTAALAAIQEARIRQEPVGEVLSRVLNQTQAKLRETQQRFRQIFDRAETGIAVRDLQGRIVESNPALQRMLGYTKEELRNRSYSEFTHPDDLIKESELVQELVTGQRQSYDIEKRYLRKDGQIIWVTLTGSALQGENGEPLFAMVLISDITERRKAEEALKESQQKYQALTETTGDFIWETDVQGRYTYCSPQMQTLWGYDPQERIGKTPFDAMLPEERQQSIQNFLALARTNRPFAGLQVKSLDSLGRFIYIEISGVPYFDKDGKFAGYRGITRDITERKKAEEALQKYTRELEEANKEMEAFNYSVSHDLRQPIRAMESFGDLLSEEYEDRLDETGKDYLRRIRKASHHMSHLTDDMLKLSRVSRADMHRDHIDLSDLARSILAELRSSQPERQAEIEIAASLSASGDKSLMTIALRNLLENAWKFTNRRQLTHIRLGEVEKDRERVYFIQDNGVGFDMQYQDKLFQPFVRLHSDKDFEGTGIGLAIVQRIIRRHGGKIWAESEKDKGTTFYFTLS